MAVEEGERELKPFRHLKLCRKVNFLVVVSSLLEAGKLAVEFCDSHATSLGSHLSHLNVEMFRRRPDCESACDLSATQ